MSHWQASLVQPGVYMFSSSPSWLTGALSACFLWITNVFPHYKVTIDLELHFTKWCHSRPSSVPFAQYDIYLHRVPSRDQHRTPNDPLGRTGNYPHKSKPRVLRWEDDLHRQPLFPPTTCRPVSTFSLPTSVINENYRQQTIGQLDTGLWSQKDKQILCFSIFRKRKKKSSMNLRPSLGFRLDWCEAERRLGNDLSKLDCVETIAADVQGCKSRAASLC